MGYDISMLEPSPDLIEARDRDRAEFSAAVKARDDYLSDGGKHDRDSEEYKRRLDTDEYKRLQDTVMRSGLGDPTYFRLNIWGMGTMRRVMDAVNLLDWDADYGRWPEVEYDDEDELGEEDERKMREFRAQTANGRVPAFKFGSNDGWIITPDECLLIAERLRHFDPIRDEGEDRWKLPDGPFAGKYVDMNVMRELLPLVAERPDLPDFEQKFADTMMAFAAATPDVDEVTGPPEELPGEPSEDYAIALKQATEVIDWIRVIRDWIAFNERAAECGGYEVW